MTNTITLTDIGRQKLAGDIGGSNELRLTNGAVGSGSITASYRTTATTLANLEWAGLLNSVIVDGNTVIITVRVPEDTGGYIISEAGIFDDHGSLIAYLTFDPPQNKPDPDGVTPSTFTFSVTLSIGAAAQVTPSIDPQGAVTQFELDTQLDTRDTRLDTLDTQLNTLDTQLDTRLDTLDTQLNTRLNTLDTQLDTRLNTLDAQLALPQHVIPAGVIWMWSGLISNIPEGWALCDGTGGRPNLRDKFVRGASYGDNPGTTGGRDNVTSSHSGNHNHNVTVDIEGHELTIEEMPAHTHDVKYGHEGTKDDGAVALPDIDDPWADDPDDHEDNPAWYILPTQSTGGGQSHTHTNTASCGLSGSHSHTHDNRPAYYALAFIMKL